MTEAEWLACDSFENLFRHLETTDLLTQRKLRLFEVAYCQRFVLGLRDPVLASALQVAERAADGLATAVELAAVHEAAREIEDESVDPDAGTDALHYGAKAIREATSPDHPDYHSGTLDMVEHAIKAVTYASPSCPKGDHEVRVRTVAPPLPRTRLAHSRLLGDEPGVGEAVGLGWQRAHPDWRGLGCESLPGISIDVDRESAPASRDCWTRWPRPSVSPRTGDETVARPAIPPG